MLAIVTFLMVLEFHSQTYAATRPNIVFILVDDLGFNDVSFHGSTEVRTPNITELAKDGILLTRHYSQGLYGLSNTNYEAKHR